jgi:hypothetical protein
MAIANYKPGQRPETFNEVPQIYPPKYNGIVMDNKYVPTSSLLSYASGMHWTVDYFCQVLGDSLNVKMLDIGEPSAYQQFSEIKNLELLVQTPLQSTQNTQNNLMVVTGNALVTANVVPNTGDSFLADIGDGVIGLFSVTSSTRKIYMMDSVFEIDYTLLGPANDLSERYEDLKKKVVATTYYTKIIENNNRPSLIASQEYENVLNYQTELRKLVHAYFTNFFNLSFNTLLIPGQEPATILDIFLVRMILKIVDTDMSVNIQKINKPNLTGEPYLSQPTFWDAMLEQDYNILGVANQQMAVADIYQFNGNPYLESAKFSFIDYVVYPIRPDESLFIENSEYPKGLSPLALKNGQVVLNGAQINTVNGVYALNNSTIPLINTTIIDQYYVLSEAFYNPASGLPMSVIEVLVTDYLNRRSLNSSMINALLSNYRGWTRLDQFYYIPILIFLLKNKLKNY